MRLRYAAAITLIVLLLAGAIPLAWHMLPATTRDQFHCWDAGVNYND